MANKILLYCMSFLFFTILMAEDRNLKCGTFQYIKPYIEHKKYQKVLVANARVELQISILTRSGKFRIHYDTTGVNEPAIVTTSGVRIPNSYQNYVDSLALILDSVWNAEIVTYGFPQPISDDGRGGGNEFDVYVFNLGVGSFGETVPEYDFPIDASKPNIQFPSYIRIDNDFGTGFRTKGIPAMKATCAHEFQHAIQVSHSGLWADDFYFYELCAEAFEPTVFPDVKDYINDVRTYYQNISEISLFARQPSGYERAIFGLFLMMRYTPLIMRNLWDEIQDQLPIPALQEVLNAESTSIENEYVEFSKWNFYTGSHSGMENFFKDAAIFPNISLTSSLVANDEIQTNQHLAKSFTSNYFKISTISDSAFVIINNINFVDAINYAGQSFPFELAVTTSNTTTFTNISNSLYAKFTVQDNLNWTFQGERIKGIIPICFPNPYNPSKGVITFLSDRGYTHASELYVYSTSMDLIYSGGVQSTFFSGRHFAAWDGRDKNGSLIPSGIYFYYLIDHATTIRGKFAVIR